MLKLVLILVMEIYNHCWDERTELQEMKKMKN